MKEKQEEEPRQISWLSKQVSSQNHKSVKSVTEVIERRKNKVFIPETFEEFKAMGFA